MIGVSAILPSRQSTIVRIAAASLQAHSPQMRAFVIGWRIAVRRAVAELPRGEPLRRFWRAYVRLSLPVAIGIAAIGCIRLVVMLSEAARLPGTIGIDLTTATDAAHRWLSGSSPYLARQLAGPYQLIGANPVDSGEMLYPPIALPMFAIFTALPAIVWWAIPAVLGVIGLFRTRPAAWTWPLLALCLFAGQGIPLMIAGNPTIWVVAGAIWAPSLGWPGPLLLLKPTVAPLALLGILRRSWWVSAAIVAVVSLGFGSLWVEWFHVVANMRAPGWGGILYSFQQLPILMIPLIVVAGARPKRTSEVEREAPADDG